MNGCMTCGKELQIGDRVVWRCEDCARKQMEEYDNKCQRIAELEEQLKNAIVPKFKIGQEVWFIDNEKDIQKCEIYELKLNRYVRKLVYEISYNIGLEDWADDVAFEEDLFATKEEAEAKLKELGENNVSSSF